jgi:site-specific DNA-methyltransferase (adenine-specific)
MTPKYLIDEIEDEFGEIFDPCPAWTHTDAPYWNGLECNWSRTQVNFCNPPYSEMKDWVKKAHDEWQKGSTVILLIPPRTCTKYFHDYINHNAEIRFIKGRVKFIHPVTGEGKSAPFPSILCIFHSWRDVVDGNY